MWTVWRNRPRWPLKGFWISGAEMSQQVTWILVLRRWKWLITYLLTPWHYSPDGHKPPLIRFHSLIFSVFEEQVANLLPQHFFESAWFNNQRISRVRNRTQEIWPTKHLGRVWTRNRMSRGPSGKHANHQTTEGLPYCNIRRKWGENLSLYRTESAKKTISSHMYWAVAT
jgi:hypothetical protein